MGAMEARLDAPSARQIVQSIPHVSAGNSFLNWRLSAACAQSQRYGAERRLSVKRSDALWWLTSLSAQLLPCWGARRRRSVARSDAMVSGPTTGRRRRLRCLGSCVESQAMQARTEQSVGACRDRQASDAVVAGTDRRAAQAY